MTAATTSAPPASCTGPRLSPKIAIARPTVTTGSTVDTIEAVEGPTRSSPRRKVTTGRTVEITTTATMAAQPSVPTAPRCGPPVATVNTATETAAAVRMIAVRTNGSAPPTARSATRM
jgi:hypothetical protein